MSVIAVFNQTDGVGKTTTSVNLLAGIAQRKQRPLGIDLDPQAHLSSAFGAHPSRAEESVYSFFVQERSLAEIAQITKSGIVLCPAHVELAKLDVLIGRGVNAVTRLRLALSAPNATPGPVVIDCCSLLGVLSLNAIFACDVLIVPVSANYLAFQGAQQVERMLNTLQPVFKRRLPRRYVLTRFDEGSRMSAEIADLMAMSLRPGEFCSTRIAENANLAERSVQPLGVSRDALPSRSAPDYQALVEELARAGFVP